MFGPQAAPHSYTAPNLLALNSLVPVGSDKVKHGEAGQPRVRQATPSEYSRGFNDISSVPMEPFPEADTNILFKETFIKVSGTKP